MTRGGSDPGGGCAAAGETLRMISFCLGMESYAVEIREVREVVRLSNLTRTLVTPAWVAGVTNLRGEILSVLDIRPFLGLRPGEPTGDTRVIITEAPCGRVGVLVDRVDAAFDVDAASVQPTLGTLSPDVSRCIRGQVRTGDVTRSVLDLGKALQNPDIDAMVGE